VPELALDSDTSPPRVLPPYADQEVPEVSVDRNTARGALPTVCPLATNELAVPPQERLGSDQKGRPALPRQEPARCSHQDSVVPAKSGRLHPPEGCQYSDS
jgi:hypothetical protein